MKCLFLLFVLNTFCRILMSDDSTQKESSHPELRKNHHRSKLRHINHKGVHDDPDRTDVNLRKNRHRKSRSHSGTILHVSRRLKCRCKNEDMNCKCTHSNKQVPDESESSDDNIQIEHASHSQPTSTTRSPVKYSVMQEVKPGKNAELDATLAYQKIMEMYKNNMPKMDETNLDYTLKKADKILKSRPAEKLKSSPSALQSKKDAIDAKINSNMLSPLETAENSYNELKALGVPHKDAAIYADEIANHIIDGNNKKVDLLNALKESAEASFIAANHRELQEEVQYEKEDDLRSKAADIYEESEFQKQVPNIHPIHLNEEELSYLKSLKNMVTAEQIKNEMTKVKHAALNNGESEESAIAKSLRRGSILTQYNKELRNGASPSEAVAIVKKKALRQKQIEQRREMVQKNGPEIAQMMAEKTDLTMKAAKQIAKYPEHKQQILEQLDRQIKMSESKHATMLHEISNDKAIRKPRNEASNLLNGAKEVNSQLLATAYDSPVVTKELMKKGLDHANNTAKAFKEHLEYVNSQENKHIPNPKSALQMLEEVQQEQKLNQISKESAEKEKALINKALKEKKDAEVMETEEKLAKANNMKKIKAAGKSAANKVLQAGGSIEEAKAVQQYAEISSAKEIEKREDAIKNDAIKSLNFGMNSEKATKIARHVAIAHSGDNGVGKTQEEVMKNEMASRKQQAFKNAMYSNFSNENINVVKVIPADASEVSVDNSVLEMPLMTFINEKAQNEGEAYVKNKTYALRNLIRNTITKKNVDSGLNKILTGNGVLNVGENAKSIHIENGVAYIKPSCKLIMEKQGIDTSYWKPRHNQGERPNISDGILYYEAKITNADLQLPSPSNKTPSKLISNGSQQLNADCVDEIHIKKGTLKETPWKEFSDLMHPRLNLYSNEEQKIKEANAMKHDIAEEKKREALESIKVIPFTNPSGDKHILVLPQYGVPESFEEEEGMKRLANIDPNKNVAISEVSTNASKNQKSEIVDEFSGNDVIDSFIDKSYQEAATSSTLSRAASSINGFTNAIDQKKASLTEGENTSIDEQYVHDTSTPSNVKNSLIKNSSNLAKQMNVSKEEFINTVKSLPDDTIYKMIKYNQEPEKGSTDIVDSNFFKIISSVAQNLPASKFINTIFSVISKVTGQPNNVGGTVIDKHIVPNVTSLRAVETTRYPGGASQVISSRPTNNGTTVMSHAVTSGNPRIQIQPNSNFTVQNIQDSLKQPRNNVKSNGTRTLPQSNGQNRNQTSNIPRIMPQVTGTPRYPSNMTNNTFPITNQNNQIIPSVSPNQTYNTSGKRQRSKGIASSPRS